MSNQPILSHRPLRAEGDKEERTGREGGQERRKMDRPGRKSGLCPWLPGLCTRCLWRAEGGWSEPARRSASASSRRLWQRSKSPGLLGP